MAASASSGNATDTEALRPSVGSDTTCQLPTPVREPTVNGSRPSAAAWAPVTSVMSGMPSRLLTSGRTSTVASKRST